MSEFQTVEITLDAFLSADEHVSTRGRKKGASKTEREFTAWYSDNPDAPAWLFRGKDYAGLRRAVSRADGVDSSKVEDYESALENLGLIAKVVAREGSGNEQVVSVAIARTSALASASDLDDSDDN